MLGSYGFHPALTGKSHAIEMLETDPETTAPMTPPPPPATPPKRSSGGAGRLLLVGLLAFLLATFTGRLDLSSALASARDALARSPAARVVPGTSATVATEATVAAIKDVITRANRAQIDAFAKNDVTLMRATATDSYYQELVRINRDLANGGVSAIALTNLTWGDVTVSGSTARATTFETWRSSYTDGSTDERTDRNDYTLVADAGSWKIQSDVQPDAQLLDPSGVTTPSVTTPASSASQSSNWSGYVASGGTFTSVTGSWIVPTVSAASTGADATWVGIGGLNSNDLIQAGTQATVSGGDVTYEAWIEMLPASSKTVPLSVSAGDSVTVSLTQRSGRDWAIAMKNNTTGETYNVTVQYSSSVSSAEWVQEAPSAGRGVIPLDDFGALQFTGGSAVRDGASMSLAALGARAITMINSRGEVIAQPSTLASDGSSFTVTRTSAQSTTRGTNPNRRRP